MKKTLPIVVAVLCGITALVDFFVVHPVVDALGGALVEGVMILAAFALLLGILNLLGVHAQRIAARRTDPLHSLVLIVALLSTLVIGVTMPASPAMAWIFDYLYFPLQSTLAALLAFFIVIAAYRAFRLRSSEALILLVSGVLMFFLQLPFSGAISPALPLVRDWLLAVPIAAGVRGLILGVALGTVATSLRILFAVDRPYVGK